MTSLAPSRASRRACLSFVTLLAACGGGTTEPAGPTVLEFTAGLQQSGPIGSVLPVRIVVLARNSRGPVAAVTVTMSVDAQGGGTISPHSANTGTDGTAQFTWTLGSKLGVQTLTAATSGEHPLQATLSATATAAPASVITALTNTQQNVVVGRAVPTLPSVLVTDNFGNSIAGASVTFEAVQGASVLSGTGRTTDSEGKATLGGWTIGSAAGSYTIRARLSTGAEVTFEARGVPAALTAVAGMNQTANVGTAVSTAPAVRASRDDGSALPGVVVGFTVVQGGGSLLGASMLTGSDGIARPTRWVLGGSAGPNRLEAATLGAPPVFFDATGAVATPAAMVASGGTALTGFFGNYLTGNPEVTVNDAQGNPVSGVGVVFAAGQGGGQLTNGVTSVTNFEGKARATSWRLGGSGVQTATATVGTLPPVIFTANGSDPPAGTFRIEIRYPGQQPNAAQQAAFDNAAARWKQLILAGGVPYQIKPGEVIASCGSVTGTIDGVVIIANFVAIDGPSGVLGRAGFCVIRDEGFLPVTGLMEFDIADLPGFAAQFDQIVMHEMGHVLGFGSLWDINIPGLGVNAFRDGVPGPDPTYNGLSARGAFFGAISTGTFLGTPIPLEATGGPGTAYVHWRESTFGFELMTGLLNPCQAPPCAYPLSAMTVQQFRDLGYVVNDAAADSYSFAALVQGSVSGGIRLVEGQLPGVITVVNRQGRAVARIPRPLR